MKQTEMRRITEIYCSADVPFTEKVLPPSVLNTKGGTQRLWKVVHTGWLTTHLLKKKKNQQTDIRRINKT